MTSSSPKNEVNWSCDLGICWSTTIPSGLKTTTFPSAFGLVSLSKSGSKMLIRIAATTNKKIEVAKVKRIAFQKKSLPQVSHSQR